MPSPGVETAGRRAGRFSDSERCWRSKKPPRGFNNLPRPPNLGSGTGQLKLRMVYDMFVQRFPWLARLISFEKFAGLVDEALVEMRNMLAKNAAVRNALGVWEE